MLIGKTYTPDLNAEAAILPLLPDHLRAQALRLLAQLRRQVLAEQARLLEMARSIEKVSAGKAGDNLNITRKTYQGSQKQRAR